MLDLKVLSQVKSDNDKFEAQLKPTCYEGSLIIQTKIELVRDCGPSWDEINEAFESCEDTTLVVCLVGTESVE